MRTLTLAQLDDLYRAFKRDVPLDGYRHAMTITEYYNQVWLRRQEKEGSSEMGCNSGAMSRTAQNLDRTIHNSKGNSNDNGVG